MRVAVLFNNAIEGGFLPDDNKYIDDAMSNAKRIAETFNDGGHEARLVEITKAGLVKQLNSIKKNIDIVFNLTESVGLGLVLKTIGKLEELNIPYCGANVYGHKTTSDKLRMKRILIANGIPTPHAQFFRTGKERLARKMQFPLIIKATTEHGSMSVHQDAVVTTEARMREQVEFLLEKYDGIPVMAEEYIAGREINSTVIGSFEWSKCLPLSEVVFKGIYTKPGVWPIYTYEAKYNHGQPDFDDAPTRLVDWLAPEEEKTVCDLSVKVCKITQCFDYARIDLRFDKKKRIPYFVDVNSYPCLLDEPETDTIAASRQALGWEYLRILEEIAKSGIKRWQKKQNEKAVIVPDKTNQYLFQRKEEFV